MENRMVFRLFSTGLGILALSGLGAQVQPAKAPAFDVASVKAQGSGDNRFALPAALPGGRFIAKCPLRFVIAFAYKLPFNPDVRLSGIPDWAASLQAGAVFDIEATGAMPPGLSDMARVDRTRLMVQTLLADRFRLAIRRETKEMPVYALVVGKGGPKLQRADIEEKDCAVASAAPPAASDIVCHSFIGGRGRGLKGRAVDMSDLASYMENWTDRPLLDKTGITGLFHIETKGWLPMEATQPPAPGAKAEDGTDLADLPTIFQVFDQLGLKMEPRKDKADVYIVDHIERPTEN
jgi:uncharacterized protein (TIGR03435 family)